MKKIMMITGMIILMSFSLLFAGNGRKCVSGNCVNGHGTMKYTSDGSACTYVGDFKKGKFNGQGKLSCEGQFDFYENEGKFVNGEYVKE